MNIQTETKTTKPTHEQIASLAHQLWERGGYQHGRDLENWLEAEKRLNNGSAPVLSRNEHSAPGRKPRAGGSTTRIFRRGGIG